MKLLVAAQLRFYQREGEGEGALSCHLPVSHNRQCLMVERELRLLNISVATLVNLILIVISFKIRSRNRTRQIADVKAGFSHSLILFVHWNDRFVADVIVKVRVKQSSYCWFEMSLLLNFLLQSFPMEQLCEK